MSYSDPLGIQAAIDKMQESHTLNPITEEMAEDWNNHPVTRHLKQTLQAELHYRLRQVETPATHELIQMVDWMLDYPIVEVEGD